MFLDTPPFPTNGCSSKLGSPELVVSPARHDRFWMILDDFGIQGCGSRFHPVFCRDSYGAYNLSGTSSQSRGSIVAAAGSAVAITPDFLFDRWQ